MTDARPRRLIAGRLSGSLLVTFLLLLGAAIRVAYAFPAHKYVPDADSLNMGLRALQILDGDLVIFFSGAQLGALEAYLHAAAFLLLGHSRETIALAPLVVGFVTLIVFFLFIRELLGPRVATLSLLFLAVPSPFYLAWTYLPNSYPETLLLCVTNLWLAARIGRRGFERWSAVAFGFSGGLGWWNSPLTLSCTLPAVLWMLAVRPDTRRMSFWRLPAAGFLVGAIPWVAYNVRYGFPSVSQVMRPARHAGSIGSAAMRLFGENAPQLGVGMDPFGGYGPLNEVQRLSRLPAGLVIVAAVLLFAVLTVAGEQQVRKSLTLLWLVAVVTGGLFVFSASGTFPGPTVRYVLPIALVLAVALGLAADFACRRSRLVTLLVALPILLFNLSGYYWPWTAQRRKWAENQERDARVVQFLKASRISWICGEYWTVYPFNFLSGGRLKAVPYQLEYDFYRLGSSLPDGRMALVSRGRDVEEWARRAGLEGSLFQVGPGYVVLLPRVNPPSAESSQRLYARLVAAARSR
jgi:hypothetical protein